MMNDAENSSLFPLLFGSKKRAPFHLSRDYFSSESQGRIQMLCGDGGDPT